MNEYNYLHIALRGETDGAPATLLAYPAADGDRAWEKLLVTPGAAIKRFLNASECYILQDLPEGHLFSLIARNPLKPAGDGYEMISVMVDAGCSLTGKQLMALFASLKKSLIDQAEVTEQSVTDALTTAQIPQEPVRLSSWIHIPAPEGKMREEAAYRTYISTNDLATILSFPSQPDYAPYRCVIVVPATASLRPGVKMPRITAAIRRQYTIVAPEGVTVSADRAFDGDRITVTFAKPGFDSRSETIIVGNPSAFTRIEGSTLKIKAPSECGIRFVRKVKLEILSAKGGAVKGYTVAVNGRSVNTMEPYVEFSEKDLAEGATVEIKVASNNYAPVKIEKPAEELLSASELRIELQPIEQGVTLRLDFGDGRIIEQHILIEKNTPEYNRLHSGNFHGFRAHRLVTADHSEVYNVDVRFDGRPVAPNFETAEPAGEQSASGNAAPVFENVTSQDTAGNDKIDASVPTLPDDDAADAVTDEMTDEQRRRTRNKWLIAAAAAVIALVVALVVLLPSGEKLDATPAAITVADDATGMLDTTAAATAPAAPAATSAGISAADVEYLNSNSLWDASKLTSEPARKLIQDIAAGNIEAVAANPYFATPGMCTNSAAEKAVNFMWRASGTPTHKRIVSSMTELAKGDKVDLKKLVDRLARFQPVAADANQAPRPGL